MDIHELKFLLDQIEIPKELYSLEGGYPSEAFCMESKDGWQVYYSERGQKTSIKVFTTENEACQYFLKKVLNYAIDYLTQQKLRKRLYGTDGRSLPQDGTGDGSTSHEENSK